MPTDANPLLSPGSMVRVWLAWVFWGAGATVSEALAINHCYVMAIDVDTKMAMHRHWKDAAWVALQWPDEEPSPLF